MSEEAKQEGVVTITVTDGSVKYDSNMSIPETVFWLEVVKGMASDSVFAKSEDNA